MKESLLNVRDNPILSKLVKSFPLQFLEKIVLYYHTKFFDSFLMKNNVTF